MSDGTFEDRFLIREVYGRYAMAVARQHGQEWLDCWSDSATWKTPHFEVNGRAALEQTWEGTWAQFDHVSAFNEVGAIHFANGKATTLSNVLEIIILKGGAVMKMVGLYTDEFAQENGRWKFSRREYSLIAQEMAAAD